MALKQFGTVKTFQPATPRGLLCLCDRFRCSRDNRRHADQQGLVKKLGARESVHMAVPWQFAGTIAHGNNRGVVGVAPGAEVISLKIFDSFGGASTAKSLTLQYATSIINQNGRIKTNA